MIYSYNYYQHIADLGLVAADTLNGTLPNTYFHMDNTLAYGFSIFKYGILEYYFYDSKAADEC